MFQGLYVSQCQVNPSYQLTDGLCRDCSIQSLLLGGGVRPQNELSVYRSNLESCKKFTSNIRNTLKQTLPLVHITADI